MPDDSQPDDSASSTAPEGDDAATTAVPSDDGADDGADDAGDTGDRKRRRRTPVWLETVLLLVVALAMALIIKTFFVQAFYIPSASMEPGLVKNDRILVQKVSYWFGGQPDRGDVIVFEDPGGWLNERETGPTSLLSKGLAKIGLYPTGGHLVKRVIGTPGDTIVCCDDDGRLTINGVVVDEDDFVADGLQCDGPMVNACQQDWKVGPIPDDMLFVMGDNRAASADSSDRLRLCRGKGVKLCAKALVPTDLVVGKVFALVWPLSHSRFIGTSDAFDSVEDAR